MMKVLTIFFFLIYSFSTSFFLVSKYIQESLEVVAEQDLCAEEDGKKEVEESKADKEDICETFNTPNVFTEATENFRQSFDQTNLKISWWLDKIYPPPRV